MSDAERPRPAPDQNDPTGHSRPGSPSYHPGDMPANNMKPSARPRRMSSEDEPEGEPQTGVLRTEDGRAPGNPAPMTHQGAPD
jgi:hypothetical protein